MLRAHWCYAAAHDAHGTAAIVSMAAAAIPRLQAEQQFKVMAALTAGVL